MRVPIDLELNAEVLEAALRGLIKWAADPAISRSELAKACGTSRQTMYRPLNEGEDWDPSLSMIIALAYAREKMIGVMKPDDLDL